MSKVSKFYSDSYFFGIAQLIERLISFFMLPVLVNSVSKVEYAIWTQSIVTAGILMPIVLMGFQTAIVKYLPRWSENLELSNSILTAIILAIFTWICFICIFFLSFGVGFSVLIFGSATFLDFIPILLMLVISEALFEFVICLLRAKSRVRTAAVYIVLRGIWRISIITFSIYFLKLNSIKHFKLLFYFNALSFFYVP